MNTTAVDDVTVDPNNHNTVYAATGDISFGSYAFGSAGVLKSTDAGATWTTLGANTFSPVYPPSLGGSYPQYQAVDQGAGRPEQQQHGRRRDEDGPVLLLQRRRELERSVLADAYTSQRQDITDLILRDDGSRDGLRGGRRTRLRDNGPAEPRQERRERHLPAALDPASGCPADLELAGADERMAGRHRKRHRLQPADRRRTSRTVRFEREQARPDRDGDRPEQSARSCTPRCRRSIRRPICGALQVLGDTTSRGCFLGLWRTANGGTTLDPGREPQDVSFLEGTATAGPCGEDTPQMWYDMGLAVDPNNPDALFMDAIDIWKSTDGGKTLTDVSCGYYAGLNPIGAPVHVDNHVLAYQPGSSTNLLAGNDGGIYVSNNAANAPQGTRDGRQQPADVQGRQPDDEHDRVLRRRHQRQLRHRTTRSSSPARRTTARPTASSARARAARGTGCQWSQRIGGDGFYARIEPKQGQRVFMESQNGALQRSHDRPGRSVPGRGRRLGRRRAVVHLPLRDRQVRLPDADLRPHDRGHLPRVGVDQRAEQLVPEQPRT